MVMLFTSSEALQFWSDVEYAQEEDGVGVRVWVGVSVVEVTRETGVGVELAVGVEVGWTSTISATAFSNCPATGSMGEVGAGVASQAPSKKTSVKPSTIHALRIEKKERSLDTKYSLFIHTSSHSSITACHVNYVGKL